MAQYALPCFVCQKPLLNIAHEAGGTGNQPSGGLEFSTPGHYGTTVFDPMDGSRLVINICDPCLSARMVYTKWLKARDQHLRSMPVGAHGLHKNDGPSMSKSQTAQAPKQDTHND